MGRLNAFATVLPSAHSWLLARATALTAKYGLDEHSDLIDESLHDLSTALIEAGNGPDAEHMIWSGALMIEERAQQLVLGVARRYHQRGLGLDMTIGMLKIYRWAYAQAVSEAQPDPSSREQLLLSTFMWFDFWDVVVSASWPRFPLDQDRALTRVGQTEEEFLRMVYEAGEAISLLDIDGVGWPTKFIEVNEACCRLCGLTRQEAADYHAVRSPWRSSAPDSAVSGLCTA